MSPLSRSSFSICSCAASSFPLEVCRVAGAAAVGGEAGATTADFGSGAGGVSAGCGVLGVFDAGPRSQLDRLAAGSDILSPPCRTCTPLVVLPSPFRRLRERQQSSCRARTPQFGDQSCSPQALLDLCSRGCPVAVGLGSLVCSVLRLKPTEMFRTQQARESASQRRYCGPVERLVALGISLDSLAMFNGMSRKLEPCST